MRETLATSALGAPEQATADLGVGGGLVVAHRRAWVETSAQGRNDRD